MSESNLKVATGSMSIFLDLFEPLKFLFENNLGIICNSVFSGLSSTKAEVKEKSEECTQRLLKEVDVSLLMQYICQGILYALPKSRVYLVCELTELLEGIYE